MAQYDWLRPYIGRVPRIDDPLRQAIYKLGGMASAYYYPPGTADWDQKAKQLVLNEQTVEYAYTKFTPLEIRYQPGSRPVLERLVARIVKPGMSEREKVMAILKYCHGGYKADFPNPLPPNTIFLNAREEEVLKLGGGQCEDRSRVIICLCQVAGIPARLVAVYGYFCPENGYTTRGGHAIVEIFVDGGWAFFDSSLMDFYCLHPDGRFVSLWDILRNPELVENQPESVYRDCGTTREKFIWYRDEYVNSRADGTVSNYGVWDDWRYDWNWTRICYDKTDPGRVERRKFNLECRIKVLTEIGVPREEIK